MHGWASLLVLGLLLGMRHALDGDHVLAVGTIATRERSARGALLVGLSWGIGHACTLLVVGGAIIGLGWVVPPRLGLSFELLVALALIALGVVNLRGSRLPHEHRASEPERHRWPTRALGIGLVHGLAGSAAIALLVLATIADPHTALSYLALFALGTTIGMTLLTCALALPLAYLTARFQRLQANLARVAGVISLCCGLLLVYQIGFVQGLFSALPHWQPH